MHKNEYTARQKKCYTALGLLDCLLVIVSLKLTTTAKIYNVKVWDISLNGLQKKYRI